MSGLSPSQVLRELEQRARRRFGQNFLVQPEASDRIASLAGVQSGDRVLEIGPGLASLTRALLRRDVELTAVELDRDLAGWLRGQELPLRLHEADALQVDWDDLCPGEGWTVCANLPYNVATPLLMRLLDKTQPWRRLVLMFQKEVAQRLCALPNTRPYSALSLRVQARASVRIAWTLPPGAFHPPPKVQSAVVCIEPHSEPLWGGAGPSEFDRAVRAGFSQRRKTLLNSLTPSYGRERAREVLQRRGQLQSRAQELTLAEWAELAAELQAPG